MAALTAPRLGTVRQGDNATIDLLSIPVAAATKIFAGSLVCISATGFAVPGATAAGLTAVGRAEQTVDNLAGAASAKFIEVRRGTYKWLNAGGDAILQADLLKQVYVTDDQTVSRTATGKSVAGRFMGFASDGGVFVETLGF